MNDNSEGNVPIGIEGNYERIIGVFEAHSKGYLNADDSMKIIGNIITE